MTYGEIPKEEQAAIVVVDYLNQMNFIKKPYLYQIKGHIKNIAELIKRNYGQSDLHQTSPSDKE